MSRVDGIAGVLEIGPGVGVLTKPLSERSQETVAVELDDRVLAVLADYAPAASIVHQDVLETDLGSLLDGLPMPRAVVSNMPYNITGPLLTKIAAQRSRFSVAVLMMQREVGDRILAPAGDRHRGSLSVFLQSQFAIEKVCLVPGGAFMPPPKVESIVLQFTPNDRQFSDAFFALVRAGFVQPRKTLWNNVAATGIVRPTFDAFLESQSLPDGVRPHQLTLAHWEVLAGLASHR